MREQRAKDTNGIREVRFIILRDDGIGAFVQGLLAQPGIGPYFTQLNQDLVGHVTDL